MGDYVQTLERLYKKRAAGVDLGLHRMKKAVALLNLDKTDMKIVQVAGTNGKGSVCAMLAAALKRCGVRCGLYTSPHLCRYTERFRIDGAEVDRSVLAKQLAVLLDWEQTQSFELTFFEISTLLAMKLFVEANLQVAVLEVGLGGRLDATSAFVPTLCAITSIGVDHQQFLGDTVRKIAAEKAGIARAGVPLLVGAVSDEVYQVIEQHTRRVGAPLIRMDTFGQDSIKVPWPGRHQQNNARLTAELFGRVLKDIGVPYTDGMFERGAAEAVLPGRFEWLTSGWLLDGAHNLEAIEALLQAIAERHITVGKVVFGPISDKPVVQMLALLQELEATLVMTRAPVDRGVSTRRMAIDAGVAWCDTVAEALALAVPQSKSRPTLVTGSFFTVGRARALLLEEPTDPLIPM